MIADFKNPVIPILNDFNFPFRTTSSSMFLKSLATLMPLIVASPIPGSSIVLSLNLFKIQLFFEFMRF